jgi:hypothetical protein
MSGRCCQRTPAPNCNAVSASPAHPPAFPHREFGSKRRDRRHCQTRSRPFLLGGVGGAGVGSRIREGRHLTRAGELFHARCKSYLSGWEALGLNQLRSLYCDNVTPRTVVNWHRAGFRLYWTWIARVRRLAGRECVSKEIRLLIFRMVAENATRGAPRIHGELLKLGFDVSERSVSRWIRRAPRDPHPGKQWLTFLRNHREAIAAMDFFTVPTFRFGVLHCFFIIAYEAHALAIAVPGHNDLANCRVRSNGGVLVKRVKRKLASF